MPFGDIGGLHHTLIITCRPAAGETFEIGDPVSLVDNYTVSKKGPKLFGQIYNVYKESVEVTVRGVCRFKYAIKPKVGCEISTFNLLGNVEVGLVRTNYNTVLSIDEENKTVDVLLG